MQPVETSYAAMGRFGNVFLTSGHPDLRLAARAGEVVRLWLTNTANTRVFNLTVPGARLKLVGGDSGRVEHQELVEQVLVAPSERVVVDVLVERPGELYLEHHTPDRTYRLATLTVTEGAPSAAAAQFGQLRRAPELEAERWQLERWLAAPPDKVLALVAQMDDPAALPADAGPVTYACPMHPEVTSDQPGRCPKCGMKLLAVTPGTQAHAAMAHEAMGHGGRAEGIEWEDDMVEVNRLTTTATMHWRFLDRTSGADSPAIDWRFTVGDRVKLRLVNEMDSDHPMHHRFHLHGRAGSWSFPVTGSRRRIWSGRTPCWSAPARSSTSCSTCPTRGCGWPLPHRRAHAVRHDVQLQRRPRPRGGLRGPAMQIAIVLSPGLTALDAVGPYEVLRLLPDADVRFVAAAPGPVVTDSGVLFLGATHSYAETPSPDLVLVPGSGPRTATAMADTELLDWLRQVHETTRWTTSVCTGAMILAAAAILDGLPATTHWMVQSGLAAMGAKAQRGQRIVPAGKVVTAAGVSAGLDLGLWLAGEIAGRERAEAIQLYIEYDPQPPFDAGHPTKASKAVVDDAKALGRKIALNPSELRAVPTVAWRRALNGFRARAATRATKGVHR